MHAGCGRARGRRRGSGSDSTDIAQPIDSPSFASCRGDTCHGCSSYGGTSSRSSKNALSISSGVTPGMRAPEHAGHRQRVVRVAAEHLEQVGLRWVLVLVVVEGADPRVRVAQAGAHPLADHEALPQRAERFGNTSAALPRVHAGKRSPSVESPNQVLSLLRVLPLERATHGAERPYCSQSQGSRPRQITSPARHHQAPWHAANACRSCPSGCAGSRRRSGSSLGHL